MDSGELAAVVFTFGIPHPTGYPLYLILGFLVSHLPFGISVIYKLNLFSAITSSVVVVFLYYAVCSLLTVYYEFKKEKKSGDKNRIIINISENTLMYIAFITSVCFGLSKTFWSNAVTNEVYSLHTLFMCIIIYYSLKIYSNFLNTPFKLWMALFLFLGLSFSNHLTTVFVIPALVYLLHLQFKASPGNIKKVILYSLLIIPGFLLYAVLLVASAPGPYFNWSSPDNFSNLLYHISGGDFSSLLTTGSGLFSKNLKAFGSGFFGEFAIASGIAALLGYIILYKKKKEVFIFFTLLIVSTLAFALNYNVRDAQNYFLLLYISLSFTLSIGIFEILKYLGKKLNTIPLVYIAATGIILIAAGTAYNYESNNNNNNYVIEDFTLNIIDNLEPGALFVTYNWGYAYPSALYYQQVDGKRQDLKVIMIRFLAAPWYLNTLKKYYPDLYSSISNEADEYIAGYNPDDNRNSVNLVNLVRAFIRNNIGKIPFYVSSDLMYNKDMPNIFSDYSWKPGPLCYRIIPKSEPYDNNAGMKSLDFNFRPYASGNSEKRVVKITTAGIYFDFATYHFRNNNKQAALSFLNKSLMYENLPDAVKLKNQIINEQRK